ncbi:MAG TPA: hypothetical protein ENK07_09885, partial [Bacteroidetes bacterium]|nr:hypothetical protein [Bacteroidota bacterium]
MRRLTVSFVILAAATCLYCAKEPAPRVVFSCSPENDLYQVVQANGIATARYDSPLEAVTAAPEGAAVLILADGYPEQKTPVDSTVYRLWAQRNLRLYVEFPAALPGGKTGRIHRTRWERAVVT